MFDSVLTTFLYFIFVRVTKQSPLEDCQEFSFSTAGKRKKSIYFEFCAQLPLRKPNYFVVCISCTKSHKYLNDVCLSKFSLLWTPGVKEIKFVSFFIKLSLNLQPRKFQKN